MIPKQLTIDMPKLLIHGVLRESQSLPPTASGVNQVFGVDKAALKGVIEQLLS
jgi:hypothetical protein